MEGKGGKERERKRKGKHTEQQPKVKGLEGGDLGVDLVGSRISIMEDTLRGQCEDS